MVMQWGMSDKLGRVRYQGNEQEVFLGHSVTQTVNMSEQTAELIDSEIRSLIEDGERTARRILTEKREDFETLAQALIEFETLSGEEVRDLLAGRRPRRDAVIDPTPARGSAVPPAGKPRPRPETGGMEPQPLS
jgi:cell division protease FtsH